MKRTFCTILSILLLACATACGSDSDVIYITPESETVDGVDAVSEKTYVTVEGEPYVETMESQPETVPETVAETAPETAIETEPETVPETAPETTIETEPETAAETVPETTVETAPETVAETVPETTAETAPETAVETAPETIAETEPETVAETVPETVPETAPVTVQEPIPETTATEESVLKLVSVTTPCENGSNATLSIIGKPNTEYKISVFYSSGASKAKGLEQKTSDANGNVSWTWKVGANTTAGVHKITISGGDEVLDTSFETYK